VKTSVMNADVISLVMQERRRQPRIGGRKLYHLYSGVLHDLSPRLGRDKFFDLPRSRDLLVPRKRSSTRTTNSYHRFHRYGNLLKEMQVNRPCQAWVADITYLRLGQGFAYLSLLTDDYSRKIVGWQLSRGLGIEGPLEALKQALSRVRDTTGLVHHSDRGIQYCSNPYTELLLGREIRISMTEENHCYENAKAERVNGILKDEYMLDSTFDSFEQARRACTHAIKMYNTRRPHQALDYNVPEEVHKIA
jgi:transposase InsO family protein